MVILVPKRQKDLLPNAYVLHFQNNETFKQKAIKSLNQTDERKRADVDWISMALQNDCLEADSDIYQQTYHRQSHDTSHPLSGIKLTITAVIHQSELIESPLRDCCGSAVFCLPSRRLHRGPVRL